MSSAYYSLVPIDQKPYATLWPWYQKPCNDDPLVIQEQLESFITQFVSEGELAKAPSANAIFQALTQTIYNLARTNNENVFEQKNTFIVPTQSLTNIDITDFDNSKLIPNAESIINYISTLSLGNDTQAVHDYINSLFDSYFYKSTISSNIHTVVHNLNSDNIEYTVLVFDSDLGVYKNDLVSVIEIDNNTLQIESNEPINIKVSVRSVITV